MFKKYLIDVLSDVCHASVFENLETLSCMNTISNELLRGSVGEAGICACEVKFQIQGGHAKGRVSHFWLKLSWNYGWVLLVIFYQAPIHKGRTIRKVMVGVGNFRAAGIFFRFQIPWMNFFKAMTWIFFRVDWRACIFLSFNFPLREYFFCTSAANHRRPTRHKFSNGPSLKELYQIDILHA